MFWSWPCVSWLHTDTFIRQSPWEGSSGLLQSHCSHPYTTTFPPSNIVIILSHLLLTKQNPGIYPYLYICIRISISLFGEEYLLKKCRLSVEKSTHHPELSFQELLFQELEITNL